jgi:hypothetical protein
MMTAVGDNLAWPIAQGLAPGRPEPTQRPGGA